MSASDINRPLHVTNGGRWQEFRALVATVLFGLAQAAHFPATIHLARSLTARGAVTPREWAAIDHVAAIVAAYGAHSVAMCPYGLYCPHADAIKSVMAKGWDLTRGCWPDGGLRVGP